MKPVTLPVPQDRRIQRAHRIDYRLGSPYAENVAVLISFCGHDYVVNNGTKRESMREALELAHTLLELWDANPELPFPVHVALEPIDADRASRLSLSARTFDAARYASEQDADRALIVQSCYDVIRDCPTAKARVEAARLLQRIGHVPPRRLQ